ncbi:MAG TPA: crossover junction endodeoxyribonuclease RuvC [Gammaproteobacteria bacterium]|nr:crossover junction endodeoxyribonuclease RuvC [Gammaproteobacteria bacterium]
MTGFPSAPAQIRASSALRILGIDPGSQITGFGVVEVDGHRTTAIEWGSIRTEGDHSARLREIFFALGRLVRELKPDEISIERVFLHRNADSALKLGQARAAAICATFEADVPIYEYSARQIKQAVVGRGGADKEQVQHMVQLILAMQERAAPDAADALAAAICHAHQRGVRDLLATVKI